MNETPLVSVIIPVYNSGKYLRQCLDSVAGQTLRDIEIICVDDGSEDDSFSILEEYRRRDGRFILIRQENGGAGKARNTGIAAAKGKTFSFLDSDDFFELDMLQTAYEELTSKKTSFVVYRSDSYFTERNAFSETPWTVRTKDIAPYRPATFRNATCNVFKMFVGWAWDKLYDAVFIRKNGLLFQEQRTTNDMRFVFEALLLAEDFSIIEKVLAHHRREESSSLSNTREKSWFCFHDALISLRDDIKKFGLYNEVERDFINYCLHASLWNLDTIQGDTRKILYHKLKEEWFREFEITGKKDSYFYNRSEVRKLKKIRSCGPEEYYRDLDRR